MAAPGDRRRSASRQYRERRAALASTFASRQQSIGCAIVRRQQHEAGSPRPARPCPADPCTVKKLPSDFDIFSPSTCRKPLCIQTLAQCGLGMRAAALRDLVLVVREDQVDAAAVDVERRAQQCLDIAEHSMCQPGRPRPQGDVPARLRRRSTASTARNPSGRACRAPPRPAPRRSCSSSDRARDSAP